jgi:hypothetical protein
MENLSKFGLVELSKSESFEIIGGTMNPAEWLMYKAGQLKHYLSSWYNSNPFGDGGAAYAKSLGNGTW